MVRVRFGKNSGTYLRLTVLSTRDRDFKDLPAAFKLFERKPQISGDDLVVFVVEMKWLVQNPGAGGKTFEWSVTEVDDTTSELQINTQS
jgi:hypothetical protein